MQEDKIDIIIDEIFSKRWPNWEMDGAEVAIWRNLLKQCDFNATVKAINNFYMTVPSGKKPNVPKLFKAIRITIQGQKSQDNEALHVYTIVKESMIGTILGKRGYKFALDKNDLPEDERELENRAERDRQNIEAQKGEKMVVLQQWQKYYKEPRMI